MPTLIGAEHKNGGSISKFSAGQVEALEILKPKRNPINETVTFDL